MITLEERTETLRTIFTQTSVMDETFREIEAILTDWILELEEEKDDLEHI